MNGMELSEFYYREYGAPMIAQLFPELRERVACGLVGEGSECFGFDDEASRDHDFGPAFCIWLTDADAREKGSALAAAYRALPGEAAGFQARPTVGEAAARIGAQKSTAFYFKYTGTETGPQTLAQWRRIPESFLAVATNGKVFDDPLGEFSAVREHLLGFYPEDIRLKKIAARTATMGQAGQYNYPRCIGRGEYVAAELALAEFVRAACSIVYLLNKAYMPFYKWAHRGLQRLPLLPGVYGGLNRLCRESAPQQKMQMIEELCWLVIEELNRQGLTESNESFMNDHCAFILANIQNRELRELPVMAE